jgi:hypothetical protein
LPLEQAVSIDFTEGRLSFKKGLKEILELVATRSKRFYSCVLALFRL